MFLTSSLPRRSRREQTTRRRKEGRRGAAPEKMRVKKIFASRKKQALPRGGENGRGKAR